jgi:ATP synthase protein I
MFQIKHQASRQYRQWEDEPQEVHPEPWSKKEADAWRKFHPVSSPWRMLGVQSGVWMIMLLVAWLLAVSHATLMSLAYGGLCVILPAAMFWRGVRVGCQQVDLRQRMMKFVVWELAKIALTTAMLLAAPKLIEGLNWLALVASFVVTMKLTWLALWTMPSRNK